MNDNYVYSDLDKTLAKNPDGNFKVHYDEQAIIQSLRNILSTVSGERVRSPIGSNLIRLLFEPVNDKTAASIRSLLGRDIVRWEPRIEVEAINIRPDPDRNMFDVDVSFRIKKIHKKVRFSTALRALSSV